MCEWHIKMTWATATSQFSTQIEYEQSSSRFLILNGSVLFGRNKKSLKKKKNEMSHKNKNIDELHFLSLERKQGLNKIVSEMSSFLLLSTFRDIEKKWCDADSTAHEAVKILFRMKGDQISDLLKTILNDGLVLTQTQKTTVLSYLYTQTEKKRASTRPNKCSRNFFQTIFDKCSNEMNQKNNDNNKKRPLEASNERDRLKKLNMNAAYKSIATLIPSGVIQFESVGISPSCVLMAVPFHPGIAASFNQTVYNPSPRQMIDAQCISLPPSNTHSAVKKGMPQFSEASKFAQPIPVKPCNKDEKEKEKEKENVDSKCPVPPTEDKKNKIIPTEVMKQNKNQKLVGTSKNT